MSRVDCIPIFVVHDAPGRLHAYFRDIRRAGGVVHRARSYRLGPNGNNYACRNAPGTLLEVADICSKQGDEFVVLCDPDMIFVRSPSFPDKLSGNFCNFMRYNIERVQIAAKKIGVAPETVQIRGSQLRIGVPHVIPAVAVSTLANGWLEAIDAFPPRVWDDVMYALGLAIMKLGYDLVETRYVQSNYHPHEPSRSDIIHYCYGNPEWNKRQYMSEKEVATVWAPSSEAPPQTVLGEIFSQLRQSAAFFAKV